jgi:hypothetical protein
MNEQDHYQRAIELEASISLLKPSLPLTASALIHDAWLASFQMICVGCHRKYGGHKENHQGLGHFLNQLGEHTVSQLWVQAEGLRAAAVYGTHNTVYNANEILTIYEQIKTWALQP